MIVSDGGDEFLDSIGIPLGFDGDAGGGVDNKARQTKFDRQVINKGTKPHSLNRALNQEFFSNQCLCLVL